MINTQLYSDMLIDLFNLSHEDIQDIHHTSNNDEILLFITLRPDYSVCPSCGNNHVKVKGYVNKKITHSALTDRSCTVHYRARRYICPLCHSTYYEPNPFVFNNMKISIFTLQNVLKDLKNYHETFTSVGRRYHISPTSVASIFDRHVNISRKKLPAYINFDEVYAFRSVHSKYVCVLLDYEKQTPVDVLPSRRLSYLEEYFSNIPLEERKQVRGCCFDMYDTYRTIGKRYFPNALLCVDHFHVAQELQQIRIETMKEIHRKMVRAQKESRIEPETYKEYIEYKKQYYLLKKWNWLLMKDEEDPNYFNDDIPQKYNKVLEKNMNYLDLRDKLLESSEILKESYQIKNIVSNFYKTSTYETAEIDIEDVIQMLCQAKSMYIRNFGKTFIKWIQGQARW